MSVIKILAQTSDTVTIRRADMDALLSAAEEAADLSAVRGQRAAEQAAGGYQKAKVNYYTAEEAQRLLAGENPVRLWRQKRGMTQRALAVEANIQAGYLSEIETGKKPGSVAAYQAIASALSIKIDDLLA